MTFEKALWERGFFSIAGVDEAGRGAWAGPVAAGAVILPTDPNLLRVLDGAMDSKMMTPKERAELEPRIRSAAAACGVGMADNDEIDRIGILPATRLAMARAIAALSVSPDYLLIDYVQLPEQKIPQQSIKHGDALSLSRDGGLQISSSFSGNASGRPGGWQRLRSISRSAGNGWVISAPRIGLIPAARAAL